MTNIKEFPTNEYYTRIIKDFNFIEYKKISQKKEFQELFQNLYLFKSRNGDSYYLADSEKNILDKIEEKNIPLLIIYHCKKLDIYIFSYKCKDLFEEKS